MKTWIGVLRHGDGLRGYGDGDGYGYGYSYGYGYGYSYGNGNGYGYGYGYGDGYGCGFPPSWLVVGDHLVNLAVEMITQRQQRRAHA
jgi:hypothetical protein